MKRFTFFLAMALMTICAAAQTCVLPTTSAKRYQTTVHKKAPAKQAEEREEHGIILRPASGEEKIFMRSGKQVVPVGFSWSEGTQTGESRFVFCEDGTVYWNKPLYCTLEVARYEIQDSWVKGHIEGDKLIFEPGQPISLSLRGYPITLNMGHIDLSEGYPTGIIDRDAKIVFKITRAGKIMELEGTSPEYVLGAYNDSDGNSLWYWDFETKYILNTSNDHDPAVVLPQNAQRYDYICSGYDSAISELGCPIGNVSFNGCLAFANDKVYLGNFSYFGLGYWIEGERQSDGTLRFKGEQYLMTDNDHYDLYFYGIEKNSFDPAAAGDLVLRLDAETGDYVTDQDIFISYERMGNTLERAERIENFKLVAYPKNIEPKPIYTLPAGSRQMTYERYGKCVNVNWMGWPEKGQEELEILIATAPDGKTVYMKNPMSLLDLDAWVKGTIESDGKLHMPTMQWFQKDETYGNLRTGVFVRKWVNEDAMQYTYELLPSIKEVTFTIDNDGIFYLDPLAPDDEEAAMPPVYMYGFFNGSEEFYWNGIADAYSAYVPIEGTEVIIEETPITPDDGMDISQLCPGEKRNEYGIITDPGVGEEKTYMRSGDNYAASGTTTNNGAQTGALHMIETNDGFVFIQQPLSTYTRAYAATAWIKGYRKDDMLVFPGGQVINFDEYWNSNLIVCMGYYDTTAEYPTVVADPLQKILFTESADGQTLTLLNSSPSAPMGLFYEADNEWVGYGDYNTVWTYYSEGKTEEEVEPSYLAELIDYTLTGRDYEEGDKGYNAILAFEPDGKNVYMSDFCFWADYYHQMYDVRKWIRGTRNPETGTITFPRDQYLMSYSNMGKEYDLYFYGLRPSEFVGYSLSDLVFTGDAEGEVYTSEEDIFISWNRVTTSLNRAEQLSNVRLIRDYSGGVPYIIRDQPKGTLRTYKRSGLAFGIDFGDIYSEQQSKDAELVFSEDGKYVYMHNPIHEAVPIGGSWISGTVDEEGNLHFPTMQWVDWNTDVMYGARLVGLLYEEGFGYKFVANLREMSFSFDSKTGSYSLDRLEGIEYDNLDTPRIVYGLVWSKDWLWAGYADFDTVLTPKFDYNGIDSITTNEQAPTYYDLSGRSVSRPAAGKIYIGNGRKMLSK